MPWWVAFALTLLLEAPIYALTIPWSAAAGAAVAPKPRWLRFAAGVLLINVITHPIVWFVIPYTDPWWHGFTAAELFAWLTEAILLVGLRRVLCPQLTKLGAVLSALSANAFSAGIGLILSAHL